MTRPIPPAAFARAYSDIYEQFAVDSSFLWLLRSVAVRQPHYRAEDIAELERRLDAGLDGLMSGPEQSWEICSAGIDSGDPGDIFTATVLAFRSLDIQKIQVAVEAGLAQATAFPGLVSALGWLPGRLCHPWIKRFIASKDLNHKYLAVAACGIRREDPREHLTRLFQRQDCLDHQPLHARMLRLAGQLKRSDLLPFVRSATRAEAPDIRFWAHWAAVLLGDHSVVSGLQPFVFEDGPYQDHAVQLAFRSLGVAEGRKWIGALARDPQANRRTTIKATAALADPHAVDWLISQMRTPAVTRLAGEAFTSITGIELQENQLALEDLPELGDALPEDDAESSNPGLDEDEHLPFPDVDKVAATWEKYRKRFESGQRYVMGKPVGAEHLRQIFDKGYQRQRRAAALELALLQVPDVLLNYAATVFPSEPLQK